MKKLLCSLIAIMLCVIVVCVAGCGEDKTQKQLEKVQAQLQQITEKLNELQAENKETNDKLNALQEENKTTNDRLSELEAENKDDKSKVDETFDGKFYSLREAYANGWLTQSDIMSIAYYHNGGRAYNEEIMSEDYMPSLKTPEVLSAETQLKIKNDAAKDFNEEFNVDYAKAEGIRIDEYCGSYGDCVVLMLRDDYSGEPGVEWIDSVAEVNIYYNSGRALRIWRDTKPTVDETSDNKFYSLQEAYANGWLTQEDLQSVAVYHHNNNIQYPESLNESIAKSIKKDWAKKLMDDNPNSSKNLTEDDIVICNYYGTYNNCAIVIVDRSDACYIDLYAPVILEIGGVNFRFNLVGPKVVVWKEK